MSNTFGTVFRLTTFGESHGKSIGGILDGVPAGLCIDIDAVQAYLRRRSAATTLHGNVVTQRKEPDSCSFFSGVTPISGDGATCGVSVTLGSPVAFAVENVDIRTKEYQAGIFRPGHADYTYFTKYGIPPQSGGGRASGRETVARVVAGAIALQMLQKVNIHVLTGVSALGGIEAGKYDFYAAEETPFYALDSTCVALWEECVAIARSEGNTLGGIVQTKVMGLEPIVGEPVFDKLDARIGAALFSIGTIKAVAIGEGFAMANKRGSETNGILPPATDIDVPDSSGGILGGISSGAPLHITCAIKPIPSIAKEQQTIDVHYTQKTIQIKGRHDCSAIPRIVPVIQSMIALSLVDLLMIHAAKTSVWENYFCS